MMKYIIAAVAALFVTTSAHALTTVMFNYKNIVHNMWQTPNMLDTYDNALDTIDQLNNDSYSKWPSVTMYSDTLQNIVEGSHESYNGPVRLYLEEHETTMSYIQNLLDSGAQDISIPGDDRNLFEFHFEDRWDYATQDGHAWQEIVYRNLLEVHGFSEYLDLVE